MYSEPLHGFLCARQLRSARRGIRLMRRIHLLSMPKRPSDAALERQHRREFIVEPRERRDRGRAGSRPLPKLKRSRSGLEGRKA